MLPYIIDWLSLLGRWFHIIAGIAWIGSSFYFVWLDNHLLPPRETQDTDKGVGGEVWSVHGGGFYHAQKYISAPGVMPEPLHWFKWEAYSTWMSGIFLLALMYWYGAEIYLIDPSVLSISPLMAVSLAIAFIGGGWLIYDLLCKSPLGKNDKSLAIVLALLVSLLAWALCQVFSGRGAYIHFGAVLGTIMVANVFFVIIPGQKRMVSAAQEGEAPDPQYGIKGKQRSVHNTYFTLPVLFVMISNHYALTYAHTYNWLILIALSLAGALIRYYFVARHKGKAPIWPVLFALGLIAAVAVPLAPAGRSEAPTAEVSLDEVHGIILSRCVSCHAEQPTFAAYTSPPGGVMLETTEQIQAQAQRIYEQTVVSRVMPIGNLTQITEDERSRIASWYTARTATETDTAAEPDG
ncbi:MAG: urate hydroxylase PuuD [Pseudomonadaceae bacterium]|nr:urate hydroxylase PuuD [Pseudomonadaceae bacterium]